MIAKGDENKSAVLSHLGCVEKPIAPLPDPPQLVKDLTAHADRSDDATAKLVYDMLKFLWWGRDFRPSSPDALNEGYLRLNKMMREVERVRQEYSDVVKPAADFRFNEKATQEIHNRYKDSRTWMTPDIQKKYNKISHKRNPHQVVKGWFNVYFKKTWGSKPVFMFLVRFGTVGDIGEMLRAFDDFKKSPEYKQIVAANKEKSPEVKKLKINRDYLYINRKRSAEDAFEYAEAKSAYANLGRGSAGIASASWTDKYCLPRVS